MATLRPRLSQKRHRLPGARISQSMFLLRPFHPKTACAQVQTGAALAWAGVSLARCARHLWFARWILHQPLKSVPNHGAHGRLQKGRNCACAGKRIWVQRETAPPLPVPAIPSGGGAGEGAGRHVCSKMGDGAQRRPLSLSARLRWASTAGTPSAPMSHAPVAMLRPALSLGVEQAPLCPHARRAA